MKPTRKVATALGIGLITLLGTGLFSYRTLRFNQESQSWVEHTLIVMNMIASANIDLDDAVRAYRSYLWMGEESDLLGWQQNLDGARAAISQLRSLTAENPIQQNNLIRLQPKIKRVSDEIESLIALQQSRGSAAAVNEYRRVGAFQALLPAQAVMSEMQGEEQRLLQLRQRAEQHATTETKLVLAFGYGLVLVFLSTAAWFAQREAHERRLASEEMFRLLVSGVEDYAIYMLDVKGKIATWNAGAERINGYCAEEILGRHFSQFYTPADLEISKPASVLQIATETGHYAEEGLRVRKDGSSFWASVVLTAMRDQHGRLNGFGKVTRDITERKRTQDAMQRINSELETRVSARTADLIEANNELEAFTYTAAHDLRAPLRHMHGFVSFLRRNWYDKMDDEGRRYLDKISESASNMGSLLDDLLNFSRLGRTEVKRGRVSLSHIVESIRREVDGGLNGRKVTWDIGDLPEVEGDAALLHQVFFNLISNAVKYTGEQENAQIEIGNCSGDNDSVTVFVRDNGAGFDMEYVDKLFRVFQRLHKDEDFEGTGIGLAIVRRIVDRHGGRVWAQGTPGRGATFYISLPGHMESAGRPTIRGESHGEARLHSAGGR